MSRLGDGGLQALEALADRMDVADDPERALVDHQLELARSEDPLLAELLELLALPRAVTHRVVEVLLDGTADSACRQLLLRCVQYGFLRPVLADQWVMPDELRDPLTVRWQDPSRRPAFTEASARLVRHYEQDLGRARRWRHHQETAGSVLAAATPNDSGPWPAA